MERWIQIAAKLMELIGLLFNRKPKAADVKQDNLDRVSAGLKMAPQTKEVAEAAAKVEEIRALPEAEREARGAEVKDAQEIVERQVAAKPVLGDEGRRRSLLEKIRQAERENRR